MDSKRYTGSGPPPDLGYVNYGNGGAPKRKTSSSVNSTVSIDNPRFGKGSSDSSGSSEKRNTAIEDVFPKKKIFAPRPPSTKKPGMMLKPKPPPPRSKPGAEIVVAQPIKAGKEDVDDLDFNEGKQRRLSRPPSDEFPDDSTVGEFDESKFMSPFKKNKDHHHALAKRHMFSLGMVDREHDPDFNADEIEDIDYDKLFKSIDELPFWERMHAKKFIGRTLIALIAVCLVWITSLAFLLFVMNDLLFPRPSLTEVTTSMGDLMDFVDTERVNFADCNSRLFRNCQEDYNLANQQELLRATGNADTNDENLAIYSEARVDAKTALNNSLIALVDATASRQNGIFDVLKSGLQTEDCPRVVSYAQEQAAGSAAAGTFSTFDLSTEEGINALIDLFNERDAYSNEYFANQSAAMEQFMADLADFQEQKTAEIMQGVQDAYDKLNGCTTGTTCGEGDVTVANQVNKTQELMDAYLQQMTDAFNGVDADVEDFIDQYNRLVNAIDTINANTPGGNPLPSGSPSSQPTVSFDGLFDDDGAASDLLNSAGQFIDQAQQGLDQATGNSQDSSSSFGNEANDVPNDPAFEYNAPTLDPTVKEQYDANQAQNREDFNNAVGGIQDSQTLNDGFVEPIQRATNNTDEIFDVVTNFTDRSISFFAYDESVFNDVQIGFDSAINAAIWFDVIYRIAKTIQTINKYWNLSKIGKPPGDVRVEEQLGMKFGTKPSTTEKNLERATHPAVIGGIAGAMLVILTTVFWLIYAPFYYEFNDGCVEHNEVDIANNVTSGTMIYRNMLTIALNYAVQDGDSVATTSVDFLNVKRETDCQDNFRTTAEKFDNQANLFAAISDDFDKTVAFREELVKCIDEGAVGSSTYSTNINDPSFDVVMLDMLDGVYNCTIIPVCEVSCPDPEEGRLQSETFRNACSDELFLHATLLSTICLGLTYVTLIIFRKLFMSALVRIFWRDLNPFDFNVYASCTRDGQHLDPGIVREGGSSLEDTIAEALHKAITAWEAQSRMYLGFSLAMNLPWILAVSFLSKGIAFDYE